MGSGTPLESDLGALTHSRIESIWLPGSGAANTLWPCDGEAPMSIPKLLLLLVLLAAAPAFAAENMTVEQLSGKVASLAKERDAQAADQLDNLQLTQRLSAKNLDEFEAALPGPKSRQALLALADQSEFFNPPPADIPNRPAPSVDQQRAIIAESVDYAESMLKRLPNLSANENTTRYEDLPPGLRSANGDGLLPYQPLHPVSQTDATVFYLNGKQETVKKGKGQEARDSPPTVGMITFGEFGPIISVLYGDLPKGNLRWSHWEQGKAALEAVFRFDVPKPDSHYLLRFCCISSALFKQFPAYHGEIAIDPSKGTILRVILVADMTKDDPITKSELMVEY
ncbi:MAG: hypothetical protein ACRD25_07925, partial [Terracidiphilus sp.]